MTLSELNALPRDAAERALVRCCGSARWTAGVTSRRPFRDEQDLFQTANDEWWSLSGDDWIEAFTHHPRIGARAAGWANEEQSGARSASRKIKDALVQWNRAYEQRFGYVFLICATGKRADDMLEEMERRMSNEPAVELRVAAGEQVKITRLRLEKLLSPSTEPSRVA